MPQKVSEAGLSKNNKAASASLKTHSIQTIDRTNTTRLWLNLIVQQIKPSTDCHYIRHGIQLLGPIQSNIARK